jgi:prolyl oligopeptidase
VRYPETKRFDLVEDLHGHQVADPYRWLEDEASEETEAWSTAQDELVRPFLDALPGRDHLRRRLRELLPGIISAPIVIGERSFFSRREPDQEHATYCVEEDGVDVRVLIDPAAIDPSLTTTLDGVAPSKEGDRVAYLLSSGGREESVLHVLDVASGEDVAAPVTLGRGPSMAWLAGGRELVIVRGRGQFDRRVYRHRIGTDPSEDTLLFGEGRDRSTYYGVSTSRDGRWLTINASIGTEPRNDLYLLDLTTEDASLVTVQEGVDAQVGGGVHRDGQLYLMTDRDAPKWRLCRVDPATPAYEHWADLLPEGDDVLTDYALTDDVVIAVRTHDVVSLVTVHDLATGEARADVPLPGLGLADVRTRPDGGDDLWISYTDHLTPSKILHYDLASGAQRTWADPPGFVPVDGVTVTQVFVASSGGARVPAFVIAPEGVDLDGHRPTILYGYGGFNVAMSPSYSASVATWVEAGGVYVLANLRGGSEYGEEWHRDGMRANKQHVFDDFLAVAQWLVDEGYTSPDHLAISGGSNGGLLVGAALTQRADLFRAVVCSAPLLDMVRYEQFGLGVTWNDEYGRAEDATELGWLLGYSPYHRVVVGTAYPAVLFTVFDGDTRVDPLHARKLCASLQHATSSSPDERPVLIRREKDVGHGARAVSRTIDLTVDTMSFLASQVGLRLPPA